MVGIPGVAIGNVFFSQLVSNANADVIVEFTFDKFNSLPLV